MRSIFKRLQRENKALPKLYAVHHDSVGLIDCKRVIDCLPPCSTVALELDDSHPSLDIYPTIRKYGGDSRGFFLDLSAHAQRLGHRVYWLERPFSHHPPGYRNLLEQIEHTLQQVDKLKSENPHFQRTQEYAALHAKLLELHREQHQIVGMSAGWRSRIMKTLLFRKKDWKPTDVAFAGAMHAHDLSNWLDHPIEAHLGSAFSEGRDSEEVVGFPRLLHFVNASRFESIRRQEKQKRGFSDPKTGLWARIKALFRKR